MNADALAQEIGELNVLLGEALGVDFVERNGQIVKRLRPEGAPGAIDLEGRDRLPVSSVCLYRGDA